MSNVENTLAERGTRYGDFADQSRITQNIKRAMQENSCWGGLTDDKKEALEMIAGKIGRILNGDPEYWDSWHDIAGYAILVERRCIKPEQETAAKILAGGIGQFQKYGSDLDHRSRG